MIGERGEVLETAAFSEVSIGVRAQPESVVQAMKKLDGYRIVRPALTPTRLEDEGWSMRPATPGFRFVSCVRRQMEMPGETGDASAAPVLQTIYSDGLTYVSVFIEPLPGRPAHRADVRQPGRHRTFGQRQGDWWVTVVGDTPPATLKTFAAALERKKP